MQGMLYAEVLVAVAILALALVPATNALYAGLRSSEHFADAADAHFAMLGRMDELRAEPFGALDAAAAAVGSKGLPTSYSDPSGPNRKLVYLSRYDADNADKDNDPFTGVEADVLWLRVTIEGTDRALETLVTP
jgi:voltage-gated potassium channel Kch